MTATTPTAFPTRSAFGPLSRCKYFSHTGIVFHITYINIPEDSFITKVVTWSPIFLKKQLSLHISESTVFLCPAYLFIYLFISNSFIHSFVCKRKRKF